MRALAIAAALALAVEPAVAEEEAAKAAEPEEKVESREIEEASSGTANPWGLAIDAGLPEGAAVSVTFRPVPKLRFWAGPTWNYVAWGLQGGITAAVFRSVITPIISAEGGKYFNTDVSFLANNSQGVPEELRPLFSEMGSWYAAAHVGVEAGNPRGLSLSLRAGISYMSLYSRETGSYTDPDTGVTVSFTNPTVRGAMPSVKLGIQYWF